MSQTTVPAPRANTPDRLIEAQQLAKNYGPVVAVHDLGVTVCRGEIVGLLGPNGAGKSTTLRMLVGFQYPDSGTVRLEGHDVFRDGGAARSKLGYLPESLPLYSEMSVREYLIFFGQVKRVRLLGKAVDRVAETVDLAAVMDRPCGNLSRGYRQRVGLAQALLTDPSILILDEPTSGLDPNQIQDFRGLVRRLGQDRAILLSTHILPEALEICDRVLILNRGRCVAEGSPHAIGVDGASLHAARLRAPVPPTREEREAFALVPVDRDSLWQIQGELDRDTARRLLARIQERDWELLEWHVGSAGLEAAFRKLTLGEDPS